MVFTLKALSASFDTCSAYIWLKPIQIEVGNSILFKSFIEQSHREICVCEKGRGYEKRGVEEPFFKIDICITKFDKFEV